jgi:hypothetical protein
MALSSRLPRGVQTYCPTLMRSPVVKRQTTPESGFFLFFPPLWSQRRPQSVTCPDLISVCRCQPTWLHQTLIEVQSPSMWQLQRTVQASLCDLEMMLYPYTVLFKRLAEQWMSTS